MGTVPFTPATSVSAPTTLALPCPAGGRGRLRPMLRLTLPSSTPDTGTLPTVTPVLDTLVLATLVLDTLEWLPLPLLSLLLPPLVTPSPTPSTAPSTPATSVSAPTTSASRSPARGQHLQVNPWARPPGISRSWPRGPLC